MSAITVQEVSCDAEGCNAAIRWESSRAVATSLSQLIVFARDSGWSGDIDGVSNRMSCPFHRPALVGGRPADRWSPPASSPVATAALDSNGTAAEVPASLLPPPTSPAAVPADGDGLTQGTALPPDEPCPAPQDDETYGVAF